MCECVNVNVCVCDGRGRKKMHNSKQFSLPTRDENIIHTHTQTHRQGTVKSLKTRNCTVG